MTGTLIGDSLYSPANRRRLEHWAWVPDGEGPFPLLLLLHGVYDAGGFVWWHKGDAHRTVSRLVDEEALPPMVVLMAGDTGAEQGSGYCDWADGTARAESYLMEELLPWAATVLPVSDTRWVTGLSMGGYGSLLLALRHPGVFSSASATSGFFDPLRLFDFVEEASERMWGGPGERESHDVTCLVAQPERRAGLRIALDCGTDDPLIDENRRFHQLLRSLDVDHGYAEHAGGHEWDYWRDHLEDHLRFHAGAGGPLQP